MGWWVVLAVAQVVILVQAGLDLNAALIDASITQIVFAMGGYVINASMHSYQPSARNSWFVLAWSIALTTLCVFLQQWMLQELITGGGLYTQFLSGTLLIRGIVGWLLIILIAILTWFWVYVGDRRENEKRRDDATRLAREAELSNLRQQLQPHFLFNSLNSISALAGSRPEEARKMVQQLSDFLRGTLKKDDHQMVTLEEELKHLQLYLDIEKVRFGHRLNIDIKTNEENSGLKLPALLLQPIVENAIKFGLYDTVGEITISILVKQENNTLMVEVKNPFDSSTSQPKQGTGFGLSSVQRRLYLLFYRNDLLITSQQQNIFTTLIKIPQHA